MKTKLLLIKALVLPLLFFNSSAFGFGFMDTHGFFSPRAMGMGNAYIAASDDADGLFFNPAGLASVDSVRIDILNPYVDTNTDTFNIIKNYNSIFGSSNSVADTLKGYFGKTLSLRMGMNPSVCGKYFSVMGFDHFTANMTIRNPALPEADVNLINDYGIIIGGAVELQQIFRFGLALKFIYRYGMAEHFNIATLLNSTVDGLKALLVEGFGIGLNLGSQLMIPTGNKAIQPILGVSVTDVGQTSFRNNLLNKPPRINSEFGAGAGIKFLAGPATFLFLTDYTDILGSKPIVAKINFGLETKIPFLTLRGGFYEGYPSAGIVFTGIPLIDIGALTYATELGSFLGQRPNRRYLVQFSTRLEFQNKSSGKK